MPGEGDGHCGGAAGRPHVVLVPVPAQGHINPFISIAHYLAASGIFVTIVHSTRSHSLLSSADSAARLNAGKNGDAEKKGRIRVEVVPDGLPSGGAFSFDNFKASIPVMGKGLEELLQRLMQEDNAPCCLMADCLLPLGKEMADKFGLPRVDLWTGCASAFSIGFHIPELLARGYIRAGDHESQTKMIDFIPGLSPIRVADIPTSIKAEEGLQGPSFEFIQSMFENPKGADRMLANTIYELESSVVDALRTEGGLRIDPVGPLFMMSSISSTHSSPVSLLQEDYSCLSWLDQQQKSSVLYISFGSLATVDEDVFNELAHGLEASGESFLWVVRADSYADKASVEELLPEGFMERTCDRGLVISWAPQLAVLGHSSVGAFVTHCGWNSVLESLSNGVPMLGFPQMAEQHTNLKLIVHDWKVGLPLLEPGAGKVERSHVQSTVAAIMRGDEGTEARKSALEWSFIAHKACTGSSKFNLQNFVDDLEHGHFKPLSA